MASCIKRTAQVEEMVTREVPEYVLKLTEQEAMVLRQITGFHLHGKIGFEVACAVNNALSITPWPKFEVAYSTALMGLGLKAGRLTIDG